MVLSVLYHNGREEPDTDTPMNFGNISQELTNIEEELSSPTTKVYTELMPIVPGSKVVRGKAAYILFNAVSDDDGESTVTSKYNTESLIDQDALVDFKDKEAEFFDSNEIDQEVETKLKLICSDAAIEAEVRLMWSLNSKQTKRVQIRTKDREEAERSIRLKNHQKIRKAIVEEREILYFEKYGMKHVN